MPWGRTFRRLLNLPTRDDRSIARDVDDEVAFHLAMRVQALRDAGVLQGEAERRARAEFGDLDRARQSLRAGETRVAAVEQRTRRVDELTQDLQYSIRQLRRNPGFTLIAVLTLGLGIGANTAIFSAVRGILLQPLPFPEPGQLYRVFSTIKEKKSALSVPDYTDFHAGTKAFSGLTAYYDGTANLTGDGTPQRLVAARVTANFFNVLQIRPMLGRLYVDGEDQEGGPLNVVLGEALWRGRFGSDPKVIGHHVMLDGRSAEVIGVVGQDSRYPLDAELWLPTQFSAGDRSERNRGARWIRVVGRLAPGATPEGALAELNGVAARLEHQDPKHNTGYRVGAIGLQESLVGDLRTPLLVLLGAVGLVMLISCANVAGLLLGRTMSRDTEIAVRTALGAGRGRIIRQLLTESVVLALLGAACGIGIAMLGTRTLAQLAPAGTPRLESVRVDVAMLWFTVAVALGTGVLFGLIPAFHASSSQLQSRLKEGTRGAGGRSGRARTRQALVVGEVALAIVLLVGAGLLMRSFTRLREVDPGFRATNNTVFTVTLPEAAYPKLEQQRRFASDLLAGLQRIPGVVSAGESFGLPLTDTRFSLSFTVEGRPEPAPDDEMNAQVRVASTDFFKTMGLRLFRGRSVGPEDRLDAPPVLIVTQELVQRYFPNEDPLGKRLHMGWTREGRELGGEIVGVVSDVKQLSLTKDAVPTLYAAAEQWPVDEITFVVASTASTTTLAPAIRGLVRDLDANLPLYDLHAMSDLVTGALAQPRFYLTLLAGFAGAALLLAAVGLYGVIAYAVQQRTREIGVRMALGASAGNVLRMVLREGLGMSALGVALGLAGAAALTRLLQTLLFGVTATDPLTFAGVAGVLTLVAIAACVIPARRAASIDPQRALRTD
jgi:predicted permease